MKTLKEELQAIVDEDRLNKYSEFICVNLTPENRLDLADYREMAGDYAKKFVSPSKIVWWDNYKERFEGDGKEFSYIISEKYRFIQDLIKILP